MGSVGSSEYRGAFAAAAAGCLPPACGVDGMANHSQVYLDAVKVTKVLEDLRIASDSYRALQTHIGLPEDQGQVELSDADTLRLLSAYSDHGYALDQAYKSIGACVSRLDKLMEEMPSGESKKKKKAEYQRVITPLFFGPERPPPNYVIPQNHLAAVRVCRERKEVAWILARVVLFLEEEKKYHVEDAEMDEQQSKKNRHVVHYLNTVPIPMEEPETLTKTYEFSKDSVVFAMYPGTTCFYRAIVLEAPRRRKGTEYLLHFEDDEDETGETPSRSVDPRFVLPVPSQF